jgi:5-methyltetrahydrofolate--homocysteine methyltransferase
MSVSLKYKPDFKEARKYWEAFWNNEIIDRPCTLIWADASDSPVDNVHTVLVGSDYEILLKQVDEYFETHCFLGEAMPGFRPGFGPDQVAGFLGAPIVISEGSAVTSWSEKIVNDWESFLPLEIKEDNVCWQEMKKYHEVAEKHLAGKALIYDIDLHSNIDGLEGLRGGQKLLFDLIDTPDLVREAMNQIRKLYRKIYDEFYVYGNKENLGTTCGLPLYSSGKYNRIQSDFICLLGPDMFREFVLPAIVEEAQFLDHNCFHLDGADALKHIDDILAIEEIDSIQWVPGAGKKTQFQWPEVLHKIQNAGKSIHIFDSSIEEIKIYHKEYKPELIVYEVKASSRVEGLEFLDWLKKNT